MSITIVQLGSARKRAEGLRIGTVRRPPRGVPKSDFARLDYYDVWLPNLAPSRGVGAGSAGGYGRTRLGGIYSEIQARDEHARSQP